MRNSAWKMTRQETIDMLYNNMIEAKNELAWAEKYGTFEEKVRATDKYSSARIEWRMAEERR